MVPPPYPGHEYHLVTWTATKITNVDEEDGTLPEAAPEPMTATLVPKIEADEEVLPSPPPPLMPAPVAAPEPVPLAPPFKEGRPYHCEQCNRSFSQRKGLIRHCHSGMHKRAMRPSADAAPAPAHAPPPPTRRPHPTRTNSAAFLMNQTTLFVTSANVVCEMCDERFQTAVGLANHRRSTAHLAKAAAAAAAAAAVAPSATMEPIQVDGGEEDEDDDESDVSSGPGALS
jgi:hypothetical protein